MGAMLDDHCIDRILIAPAEGPGPIVRVESRDRSEESMLVATTLGAFPTSLLHYVASGVYDREGIGADGVGFRYPTDELDPGETPFDGVDVYNPLGSVLVSLAAFERLMSRYFQIVVKVASARHHSATEQPWWDDFVRMASGIKQRVEAASRD
jgi:hypothetical protein